MWSDSWKVPSSFQKSITARSNAGKSGFDPTGSKSLFSVRMGKEEKGQLSIGIQLPYIRTVPPGEATGKLAAEYEEAHRRAGYVAHILQLQSLNPAVLHAGVQLYIALMHG